MKSTRGPETTVNNGCLSRGVTGRQGRNSAVAITAGPTAASGVFRVGRQQNYRPRPGRRGGPVASRHGNSSAPAATRPQVHSRRTASASAMSVSSSCSRIDAPHDAVTRGRAVPTAAGIPAHRHPEQSVDSSIHSTHSLARLRAVTARPHAGNRGQRRSSADDLQFHVSAGQRPNTDRCGRYRAQAADESAYKPGTVTDPYHLAVGRRLGELEVGGGPTVHGSKTGAVDATKLPAGHIADPDLLVSLARGDGELT